MASSIGDMSGGVTNMQVFAVPNRFTEKQAFKKAVQVLPSLSQFDTKVILQNAED